MKINYSALLYIVLCFIVGFIFNGCNKNETTKTPIPETGTVTDIDNNIYKTVKIGDQWWMAENLKVTRYRDSSFIQNVTDSIGWVNATSGAYCIYENGNGNTTPPGLLYNRFVISNISSIAPEGWHIPTDAEWKTLEKYLGMSQTATDQSGWRGSNQADKLKSANQNDWASFGDIYSTNESGFTALAGSCRLFNNYWGDPGLKSTGFWWTSTSHGTNETWFRHLDYKNSDVFRSHVDDRYAFSIRCVKD